METNRLPNEYLFVRPQTPGGGHPGVLVFRTPSGARYPRSHDLKVASLRAPGRACGAARRLVTTNRVCFRHCEPFD